MTDGWQLSTIHSTTAVFTCALLPCADAVYLVTGHVLHFNVHRITKAGTLEFLKGVRLDSEGVIVAMQGTADGHLLVLLEEGRLLVYSNVVAAKMSVLAVSVAIEAWCRPREGKPLLLANSACIVVHACLGLVKYIPIVHSGRDALLLGPVSDVRIDELAIVDMCLVDLHPSGESSRKRSKTDAAAAFHLCILYTEGVDRRACKTYAVQVSPLNTSRSVVSLSPMHAVVLMDPSSHQMVALGGPPVRPSARWSVLCIGYSFLEVVGDDAGRDDLRMYAYAQTRSAMTCACLVDSQRVLLGDAEGVLYLVDASVEQQLRMLPLLGRVSAPTCLSYIGGDAKSVFVGSHSGNSQLHGIGSSPAPALRLLDEITNNLGPVTSAMSVAGDGFAAVTLSGAHADSRMCFVQRGFPVVLVEQYDLGEGVFSRVVFADGRLHLATTEETFVLPDMARIDQPLVAGSAAKQVYGAALAAVHGSDVVSLRGGQLSVNGAARGAVGDDVTALDVHEGVALLATWNGKKARVGDRVSLDALVCSVAFPLCGTVDGRVISLQSGAVFPVGDGPVHLCKGADSVLVWCHAKLLIYIRDALHPVSLGSSGVVLSAAFVEGTTFALLMRGALAVVSIDCRSTLAVSVQSTLLSRFVPFVATGRAVASVGEHTLLLASNTPGPAPLGRLVAHAPQSRLVLLRNGAAVDSVQIHELLAIPSHRLSGTCMSVFVANEELVAVVGCSYAELVEDLADVKSAAVPTADTVPLSNPSGQHVIQRRALLRPRSSQSAVLAFVLRGGKLVLSEQAVLPTASATQVCSLRFRGGDYVLVGQDDGLLVLYQWTASGRLHPVDKWVGAPCCVVSLHVSGEYVLVGDLMRSVAVLSVVEQVANGARQTRLRQVAQDAAFHWVTAVTGCVRDGVLRVFAGDDCGNLLAYQLTGDHALRRTLAVHLGEQVNCFLASSDGDEVFYMTVTGSIGSIKATSGGPRAAAELPPWRSFRDGRQNILMPAEPVTFRHE